METDLSKASTSPLETLIAFYLRHEACSGYRLCERLKHDRIIDFFNFTEVAVYRAIKRLVERKILTTVEYSTENKDKSLYILNPAFLQELNNNIAIYLSNYVSRPEYKIMMGLLYDIDQKLLIEIISALILSCKKCLKSIKMEFKEYRAGEYNFGRWVMLIHKRNRISADIKTFQELIKSYK